MAKNNFAAVEDFLNIFDMNRYWFYIPGYNGYEVSNDGYLRSMKHYVKYPYGILIRPIKREPYGSSTDPTFELSDNNNVRRKIRLSQLIHLAATNQFYVPGYPRGTIITNTMPRNDINAIRMQQPIIDGTMRYAKFTIVQKGTEMPRMEYSGPMVKIPVNSITGDVYYGRKDCRTVCDFDVRTRPIQVFDNSKS